MEPLCARMSILYYMLILVHVRSLLAYYSIIWSLYTAKDITAIESVHRRFTGFNLAIHFGVLIFLALNFGVFSSR